MPKNILFYIYNPAEKAYLIKRFETGNSRIVEKVSDILRKKFNNLFFYDEDSGCKIYSSGWSENKEVLRIAYRSYMNTISFFGYKERRDLSNCNVISDISATVPKWKA